MRNTLAIARKELRSYFTSPIGYIAVGVFALLYGYFYVAMLDYFVRQSMQAGQFGGPQTMNVNQMMIRPLLQNVTILLLFVMPMITMRAYAEEKRSGTIELLLTSPLTDFEIIMGKFVGAMGLFCAMLLVTLIDVAILFRLGTPEWRPIAAGYLGLLISSLTKNQVVAGFMTFAVFLVLWIIDWFGESLGPTGQAILSRLSITQNLDDFTKGMIDTTHLAYYLSFIAFGLFLTAKSVDSERWRG